MSEEVINKELGGYIFFHLVTEIAQPRLQWAGANVNYQMTRGQKGRRGLRGEADTATLTMIRGVLLH